MRSKLSALILVLALASWTAAPSQHHEGMVLGQETEKKEMACCNSMTAKADCCKDAKADCCKGDATCCGERDAKSCQAKEGKGYCGEGSKCAAKPVAK